MAIIFNTKDELYALKIMLNGRVCKDKDDEILLRNIMDRIQKKLDKELLENFPIKLNREICKKCVLTHKNISSGYTPVSFRKDWARLQVICPEINCDPIYTFHDPPDECPYYTEHLVSREENAE